MLNKHLNYLKYHITVFLSIPFLTGVAQVPELLWAHQFGIDQDLSGNDIIQNISVNPADGHLLVTGSFIDQVDIGISGNEYILDTDVIAGFFAEYDTDLQLVHSFLLANCYLYDVIKIENDYIVTGYFLETVDFDITEEVYEVQVNNEVGSDVFVARYENGTNLEWFDRIAGPSVETVRDVCFSDNEILIAGHTLQPELVYYHNEAQVAEGSEANDGFVARIAYDGTYNGTFVFGSTEFETVEGVDAYSDEIAILGAFQSPINVQWEGSPVMIEAEEESAFVSFYNEGNELTDLITINNPGTGPSPFNVEPGSIRYDQSGNLYAGIVMREGEYELHFNDEVMDLDLEEQHHYVLMKLSPDKELLWMKQITGDAGLFGFRMFVDDLGRVFISGRFSGNLNFPGGPSLSGGLETGWMAHYTPDGALVGAYSVGYQLSYSAIHSIYATSENELYISGDYTFIDLDLDEDAVEDLGEATQKDGFSAAYSIASATPEFIVEQSWGNTATSENGITDKIYIRPATIPSGEIEIVLTPDAQLDLGNGAGQPITLTFSPDESAVIQQEVVVAANNDLTVEGDHTGNISFSVISSDEEYDEMNIPSVAVDIEDNDVAGIEDFSLLPFSVYPNPAGDVLNISFNQPQNRVHTFVVCDLSGKEVFSESVSVAQAVSLSLDKITAGSYVVKVDEVKYAFVKL